MRACCAYEAQRAFQTFRPIKTGRPGQALHGPHLGVGHTNFRSPGAVANGGAGPGRAAISRAASGLVLWPGPKMKCNAPVAGACTIGAYTLR